MTSDAGKMNSFVNWARDHLEALRHKPSAQVADELGAELSRVNDQLGLEVGDDDEECREVIITAFSEPGLFSLVRRIAELLGDVPGWRFVALKPPRGFLFEISVGDFQVEANTFEFAPTQDIDAGIALFLPVDVTDILPEGEAEELAWLIVETGIGEELAALLQHIEISTADANVGRPIDELEEYVRSDLMRLQ